MVDPDLQKRVKNRIMDGFKRNKNLKKIRVSTKPKKLENFIVICNI